jgi:EAL domain-containing protein (putative c-di-GMP-specific phosphodiesterase class I)
VKSFPFFNQFAPKRGIRSAKYFIGTWEEAGLIRLLSRPIMLAVCTIMARRFDVFYLLSMVSTS